MNMFFNQFNNQMTGNTNNQNNNKNNPWGYDPNHDYSNDYNNQKPQQGKPNRGFDPSKMPGYNPRDMRADGNKTVNADYDGTMNTNWTTTSYSPKEGFHTTANGINYKDKNIKVNNGTYQYYDQETNDYYDIYAVNINQVKQHGKGKAAVWNSDLYGSLIDVHHSDGHVSKGIIMDACGQAAKESKIDRWDVNVNPNNEQVSWNVKRYGWGKSPNPRK